MQKSFCARMKWLCGAAAAVVLVCGMVACDERKIYDQYLHTPIWGWDRGDTLLYNIDSVAMSGTYQLALGLRITDQYPFTALTMIVEQHVFPADTIVRDTIDCKLTDDRGDFIGGGVNSYQYVFPYAERHFHKGDSIHFAVRHGMRRETLVGISEVGLTVTAR